MKYIVFSLWLVSFLPVAAASPSVVQPLASQSLVTGLTDDGSIAVGERGHIFKMTANGKYRQIISPFDSMLTAVVDANNTVFAVGHDGLIMRSNDDGESWQPVQHLGLVDRPLLDFTYIPDSGWIAVGAYGQMWRSKDGVDWVEQLQPDLLSADDRVYIESIKDDAEFYQEELSFILPHINRIRVHNNRILLAGEAGLLAFSEDNGEHWQRVDMQYPGTFFDLAPVANGYLASGLRGNLFYANKLDGQWIALATCTTALLNRVVTLDNDQALILGNGGALFHLEISTVQSTSNSDAPQDKAPTQDSEACTLSSGINQLALQHEVDVLDAAVGIDGLVFATSRGVINAEQLFSPTALQWLATKTTTIKQNSTYDEN